MNGSITMSLKPFFTYFGGKWRIAPRYPPPRHDMVIEPFAGSAGYALRHPNRRIVLVDKDPVIAGMWQWLIRASSTEIMALPTNIEDLRSTAIIPEAKALIGFWLNKGTARPCHTPSAWMRSRIRPDSYWGEAIRRRIASQVDRIRHWRIFEASYHDIPNGTATWFIDPPYVEAGHNYVHNAIDYNQLAQWSRDRQGQTIVCEHVGATWLPFTSFVDAKSTPGSRGKGQSPEAIWTNDGGDLFAGLTTDVGG